MAPMNLQHLPISALALLTLVLAAPSGPADPAGATEWTVDGQKRRALVILPARTSDARIPVLFAFHGHGGTMQSMERKGFQKHWPEALVVCPQGLPTVTGRDPEGKRAGWQNRPGEHGDRDVKFFDAILKTLREKYRVDDRRIYVTGHSNGGGFTYTLWGTRGKELAAIAPSAAGAAYLQTLKDLQPLPVLHLAGEQDEIVPFENQKRTMEAVRRRNGCAAEGRAWASVGDLLGTIYSCQEGAPFVSVIHPGTHQYPDEASALIVRFFKAHAKK